MKNAKRGAAITFMVGLIAWACVVAGSGCAGDPSKGYSFSSSYDRGVRTVHVPIFKNPTFARGAEAALTEAIIKEIQSSTPWRVVASSDADTELTGTISESRFERLSQDRRTGLSQELNVEMTVNFDWKDRRTGKTIVSRRGFTTSDAFVPTNPIGESQERGQFTVVQRLAKDIVSELRAEW